MQPERLCTLIKKVATYITPLANCPLKTDAITWTTHPTFGILKPQIEGASLWMVHEAALTVTRKVATVSQYLEEFGSQQVMNYAGENPTVDVAANVASKLFPLSYSLKPGLRVTSEFTESVAAVAAVKTVTVASITGLAGKKLNVGAKSYTFVGSSPTGDQILVGVDADATATNIANKLTADSLYTRCTAAAVDEVVTATAATAGIDFGLTTDAPALLVIETDTPNTEQAGTTEILEEYDPSYVPDAMSGIVCGEDQFAQKVYVVIPKLIIPGDLQDDFKFSAIQKGSVTFQGSMEAIRPDGVPVNYFKKQIASFDTSLL